MGVPRGEDGGVMGVWGGHGVLGGEWEGLWGSWGGRMGIWGADRVVMGVLGRLWGSGREWGSWGGRNGGLGGKCGGLWEY